MRWRVWSRDDGADRPPINGLLNLIRDWLTTDEDDDEREVK